MSEDDANFVHHRVEAVGAIMAGFDKVSHCYERLRCLDWEYNRYTMVSACTMEKCERIAHEISRATDISDYKILFSEKEFKKADVRI